MEINTISLTESFDQCLSMCCINSGSLNYRRNGKLTHTRTRNRGGGAHKHFFYSDARLRTNLNYPKNKMIQIQTHKYRIAQDANFQEIGFKD